MFRVFLVVFAACGSVSRAHYSLGYCREHLTRSGFNSTVTLDELVAEGDYTVLYTSGLKEKEDIECARLGYTYDADSQTHQYYSYIETAEEMRVSAYDVNQLENGILHVIYKDEGYEDDTSQYVMYKQDGALLIYWCNYIPTDTFDNNIWIIAGRTDMLETQPTRKAVLDMLYHEEFRGLIDSDIEVVRHHKTKKFTKLSPCADVDYTLELEM